MGGSLSDLSAHSVVLINDADLIHLRCLTTVLEALTDGAWPPLESNVVSLNTSLEFGAFDLALALNETSASERDSHAAQ